MVPPPAGSLIVASGDGTVTVAEPSDNDTIPCYNSAESVGIKWLPIPKYLFMRVGDDDGINISTSPVGVIWSIVIKQDNIFAYNGTEITINESGFYKIAVDVSVKTNLFINNTRLVFSIARKIDTEFEEIAGSQAYSRSPAIAQNCATVSMHYMIQVDNQATIQIQAKKSFGLSTASIVPAGTRICIEKCI